ncbi:MAG: hypothetical protein ACREJ3_20060 [Polyangiaceae bacterium]
MNLRALLPITACGVLLVGAALASLAGCGSGGGTPFGTGGATSGSGASSGGASSGAGFVGADGGTQFMPATGDGGSSGNQTGNGTAMGTFPYSDCAGCTFPPLSPAPAACASSAPAINIVYPNNGTLLPPNMNTLSIQWTPYGGYQEYEVDFANGVTDVRIITKCSAETKDTSDPSPVPSGGCEVKLTQAQWNLLVTANRGLNPVKITVRGTTNGTCATRSIDSVSISFASEDLLGAIYYWKSTVSSNGTGGQIWVDQFGTPSEKQVTGTSGSTLAASCNGCHALSRDDLRMVVYSDDDDSDDEYSDVTGSLIDMTNMSTVGTAFAGRGSGQPPGFSALSPTHAYYVTSDGLGTSPTNNFSLWSGNTGTQTSTITFGSSSDRPTMPDWSADGTSVVYVLPSSVASWDSSGFNFGGARNDDDHMFGGSLYTIPYMGNGAFGTPSLFLKSNGENNYYPSYSPDGQFVVFDRVPAVTSAGGINGCTGSSPEVFCPNDSFSNPAARLMLMQNKAGKAPIDLTQTNGSPASSPMPLSNSWPRWSPFVQSYRGGKLLWVAFSSTRDYGVLVRNHQTVNGSAMYQCYPPDSYELAGGAHHSTFAPQCQQPKLWMAAITLSDVSGMDPSYPAFYLPFQDITTHNHTPQWTEQAVSMPQPDAGACIMSSGNCTTNPSACCAPLVCSASGTCQTLSIPQ